MNVLHHLLYTSVISDNHDPSCVGQIVKVSRENNLSRDITGLLIFDGYHFCQHLEGPSLALNHLMAKISDDDRHQQLQMRFYEPLRGPRLHQDWSIAYTLVSDTTIEQIFGGSVGHRAYSTLTQLIPTLDMSPAC